MSPTQFFYQFTNKIIQFSTMHHSGIRQRNDDVMSPEDEDTEQFDQMQRNFISRSKYPIKSHANISSHHNHNHRHSRGVVSFNLGRIIPKNIIYDKEFLYQENMKLKGSVQEFQNQLTKLRTRLNATQKQKFKAVDLYTYSEIPLKRESSRIVKRTSAGSPSSHNNIIKKLLRQSKDQLTALQIQNQKLKKITKYTQINQLKIQNKYLMDECSRLSKIIQSKVLDQNQYVEQFEAKIQQLKRQLQSEKDNNKSVNLQLRKKNQQIQELKSLMADANTKQKKSRKQLLDLKKSFTNDKISVLKNGHTNQCLKCERLKRQLNQYKNMVKNNTDGSKKSLKNQQHQQQQKINSSNKNLTHQKNYNNNNNNNNNNNKNETEQNKSRSKKQISKQSEQSYEQNFQNQQQKNQDYCEKKFQQTQKQKYKTKQKGKQNEKEDNQYQDQNQDYEQQFEVENDNDNDNVSQQKLKRSDTEILQDTISYRMICQRYEYKNLVQDVKQSGMKQFTLEQIATMLNDEPFFLNQQQLETVLQHVFGKEEIQLNDKVKAKDFIKGIKKFIKNFQLVSQQEEQKIVQKAINKMKQNMKKIKKQFQQQQTKQKLLSESKFVSILKQNKLKKQQIELLKAQAAMISVDIEHINYLELIKKIEEANQ